jgi:hypothetical protein
MAQCILEKRLNTDQKLEIIQIRLRERTCKKTESRCGVQELIIYNFFRHYHERKTLTALP